MQRNRIDLAADLLRVLPSRFGRGAERIVSPTGLPAKSLFPLHSSAAETSGERAATAGIMSKEEAAAPDAHPPDSQNGCAKRRRQRFTSARERDSIDIP